MSDGPMLTWAEFHREWVSLHDDLQERDGKQMDVLEEIRDSLGAMHVRFETLGCAEHIKEIRRVQETVECLRQNMVPWRRGLRLLNGKTVAGSVAVLLGLVGWDQWANILKAWAGK